MKLVKPKKAEFINNIFLMTLAASVGGVLISIATAELAMPVTSWTSLYVGLAGFTALFVILIMVVTSEISRFIRNRLDTQPEE